MSTKTTKKVTKTKAASQEALDALAAMFPQADSYNRTQLPKLVFKAQTKLGDKLDKEGEPVLDEDGEPEQVVVIKAGSFFREEPTEEKDKDGRVIWDSELLGKSLEGHIIFHRKRLQYWDKDAEEFYSTPLYDEPTDVVPLFKKGEFVIAGTPAELKAMYQEEKKYKDKNGEEQIKTVSQLKDAKVLYIIIDGKMVELTIAGSSMWEFNAYLKQNAVELGITTFNSTKEEQGSNKYNRMSFELEESLTAEQATTSVELLTELLQAIADEKAYYAAKRAENEVAAAPAIAAAEVVAQEALPAGRVEDPEAAEGDDDDDF